MDPYIRMYDVSYVIIRSGTTSVCERKKLAENNNQIGGQALQFARNSLLFAFHYRNKQTTLSLLFLFHDCLLELLLNHMSAVELTVFITFGLSVPR